MKHSSLVNKWDYILIAIGVLTLPLLIGLIPIGIVIFRIGKKWQQNGEPEPEDNIEYIKDEELFSLR